MSTSKTTTEHAEIRRWVEQRGGFPAHVKSTGNKSNALGVLRIDFPGYSGEGTLERIDWEAWFETFEAKQLAFLYQDQGSDGKPSHFSKLISRSHAGRD